MTLFQRMTNVLIGILMLAVAIFFIVDPSDDAYIFVLAVLTTGLTIQAMKDIIFFFTLARHMVGGKMILLKGVILLDFALFTGSMSDVPKIYILLYLIAIHAFSGAVEVLRAMEARRAVSGPWKMKFTHGIIDFFLALSCLLFIKHPYTALIIFSIGLIYSGLMRIAGAFRRTTFMLIS